MFNQKMRIMEEEEELTAKQKQDFEVKVYDLKN